MAKPADVALGKDDCIIKTGGMTLDVRGVDRHMVR